MGTYKHVSTLLDAYHQLECGRNIARIKLAAKRLRSFDPANEMLPELESKIAAMASGQAENANGMLAPLADHPPRSAPVSMRSLASA
jgi:hypothetical protein